MTDFAAIDFEKANGRRSSECSVGIVDFIFRQQLVVTVWIIITMRFADAEACAAIALKSL